MEGTQGEKGQWKKKAWVNRTRAEGRIVGWRGWKTERRKEEWQYDSQREGLNDASRKELKLRKDKEMRKLGWKEGRMWQKWKSERKTGTVRKISDTLLFSCHNSVLLILGKSKMKRSWNSFLFRGDSQQRSLANGFSLCQILRVRISEGRDAAAGLLQAVLQLEALC